MTSRRRLAESAALAAVMAAATAPMLAAGWLTGWVGAVVCGAFLFVSATYEVWRLGAPATLEGQAAAAWFCVVVAGAALNAPAAVRELVSGPDRPAPATVEVHDGER